MLGARCSVLGAEVPGAEHPAASTLHPAASTLHPALSTKHAAPLVYLVLAIAWSWPLAIHLGNRFTHDPGDPLLNTYLIWWNAQAVPLTAAYWNPPFYWPMRGAMALSEHLAGLWPITTPLQLLGASPLFAYNFVILTSTWWTGLATHVLTRRLTASTLAAYCAGVAFALAPYRTSQLAHLQLYACWWIPVMLLALHAYYEERRVRWLVLLCVAYLLQGLTNGYYLLFLPVLVGAWLLWFTPARASAEAGVPTVALAKVGEAWRVLLTLAVSLALMTPFLLKYYVVHRAEGLSRNVAEMAAYSARPESFLSATPILRFWKTPPPLTTEQYLFPGITALALVIAGLAVARKDGRYQFYGLAALLMVMLSAGPAASLLSIETLWHPYTFLATLPGFSGLRVPTRFFMLAVLCLAVAAGLSFAAIERRFPRRRGWLAVLVFAGLAVDGAIAGMPLGVPPSQLSIPEPGARVLTLPFGEGRVSVYAMYQSMTHRRPVVNGYSGYVTSHADVIDWALRRRDPTVLTELRRGGPLYVLVAFTDEATEWTAFMDQQPHTTMLGIEGGGRLYRMPPAAYASEVRAGPPIADAAVTIAGDWLVADARKSRALRGVELRTHGKLLRLPRDLRIETSLDGVRWETAFDDRPGGLALAGALQLPRVIPLRVDLRDVTARYVRVNVPSFGTAAVTIFGSD